MAKKRNLFCQKCGVYHLRPPHRYVNLCPDCWEAEREHFDEPIEEWLLKNCETGP